MRSKAAVMGNGVLIICPEESHQSVRRRISLLYGYADSPKGCRGRAESPLLAPQSETSAEEIPLGGD